MCEASGLQILCFQKLMSEGLEPNNLRVYNMPIARWIVYLGFSRCGSYSRTSGASYSVWKNKQL